MIQTGFHRCVSGTQKSKQRSVGGLTDVKGGKNLSLRMTLHPQHYIAGQDEAATADDGPQMEDAGPNDNTAEQLECHLCSCRRAEIDRLLEENQRLK